MKFVRIISFSLFAFLIGAVAHAEDFLGDDDLLSFDDSGFDLPEFDEYSVPVVLTATRIQQPQSDVPASVTILDADLIKRLGAKNLPDLLRYVPGMMIGPDRNNNADSVHYHGGPAALPKNLQVLINGRSMYRSGLAAVSWYELPVAVEDISRIEVVRGPNSATYGANAYQAVINILTKHAADTYGGSVVYEQGNNNDHYAYVKQGGSWSGTNYRVSATVKGTRHFKDGTDPDDNCVNDICRDSRESNFINLETQKQLASSGEVETSLIIQQAEKSIANPNDFQTNENKVSEDRYEFGVRFTRDLSAKHQIKISSYISQYYQRQGVDVANVPLGLLDEDLLALFALNPDAANEIAAGVSPVSLDLTDSEQVALATALNTRYANPLDAIIPVSGTVNADMDEFRFDIEIQDTYIYSPDLTVVSGVSFRRDIAHSDHHFNGDASNNTSRIFGSASWRAWENINLNVGVMGEKESELDAVIAPRGAVIYKLTPSQSVRLVYSESVRSPDLFEQDAYWNFDVENAETAGTLNGTTFYQVAQSDKELGHQKITSNELGYYGRFSKFNSEVDLKYFIEQQKDVIYQSIRLSDYETSDDNTIRFEGVEWQVQLDPWEGGQFRLVGVHVESDVETPSGMVEPWTLLRVHAKNQFVLSWFQDWNGYFNSSLGYQLYSEFGELGLAERRSRFERLDMALQTEVPLNGLDLELGLKLQHDLSSDSYIDLDNIYEDDTRIQLAARINF